MSEISEWLEKNKESEGMPEVVSEGLTWERGPLSEISGATDLYHINNIQNENNPFGDGTVKEAVPLLFQSGLVVDGVFNGVTPEILLEILIDRFEHYQQGKFNCEENERALVGMREALTAIRDRQKDRKERGVYSTYEK